MAKYAAHLYKEEELEIGPIAMHKLKDACQQFSKSAEGPECMELAEVKIVLDSVLYNFSNLLNFVEAGHSWPE